MPFCTLPLSSVRTAGNDMAKFTKENAAKIGAKGGAKSKGRVSPQTAAKQAAREVLRKKIEADIEPLYEAWKDSAVGHHVQVKLPNGTMRVYKRSPNAMAIKDMFERAFGKPTQPVELREPEDLSERAEAILHELFDEDTDEEIGEEDTGRDVPKMDKAPRKGSR